MVSVNPCRNCKERKVGCHGECSKYKAWRQEYEEQTAAARHRMHQKGIGYLGIHFKKTRKRGNK